MPDDSETCIRPVHLKAALAVWQYCDESCRFIFGDSLGDPIADEVLAALQGKPKGITRKEIRDLFSRHARAGHLERALRTLVGHGLARYEMEHTGGRAAERWFGTGGATNAT
jgi:hypothetical protein